MAGYVLADLRRTIRRPMGSPWDKSAGQHVAWTELTLSTWATQLLLYNNA